MTLKINGVLHSNELDYLSTTHLSDFKWFSDATTPDHIRLVYTNCSSD